MMSPQEFMQRFQIARKMWIKLYGPHAAYRFDSAVMAGDPKLMRIPMAAKGFELVLQALAKAGISPQDLKEHAAFRVEAGRKSPRGANAPAGPSLGPDSVPLDSDAAAANEQLA